MKVYSNMAMDLLQPSANSVKLC